VSSSASGVITALVAGARAGDVGARDRLLTLTYDQIRCIAHGLMRHERPDHTLEPTALANEVIAAVFADTRLTGIKDRKHFFAAVASAMRHLLIDHVRRRQADKRGGALLRHSLRSASSLADPHASLDQVDLLDAIETLAAVHERASLVATLRILWQVPMTEIAEQIGIAQSTVESDWRLARSWLLRHFDRRGT